MKKPELLLPAWDLEKAYLAFKYWADAIYCGVPAFALRTRMNVFKEAEIKEIVEYAHKNDKKVYITLNAFPHQWLIALLEMHLEFLSKINPDWLIIADSWVLYLANKICPKIPKHLSVQASTVSESWMRFWYENWVRRIILAREIPINEVSKIKNLFPEMELEYFVHWAVCMAYSWRCLLSNFMAFRDSNRGMCAHSCRWKYRVFDEEWRQLTSWDEDWKTIALPKWITGSVKGDVLSIRDFEQFQFWEEEKRQWDFIPVEQDFHWTHIMSSRDMCMIEYLKEIKESWISSLKVEWRNKTIYYLASVARAYRKALDDIEEGKKFDETLWNEIHSTANRWFFAWFLHWKPLIEGQQYEANRSISTHEFAWKVLKFFNKWDVLDEDIDSLQKWHVFKETRILVEIKNRIEIGNVLFFVYSKISEDKKYKSFKFWKWASETEVVHWWDWNAWIWVPEWENIEEGVLIRQEVRNPGLKAN